MSVRQSFSPARRGSVWGAVLVAALLVSGCARFGFGGDEVPASAEGGIVPDLAPIDGPRVPYDVSIEGVEDDGLRTALEEASRLRQLQEDPPASMLALRRRAADDADRMGRVLRSRGHYAATVGPVINQDVDPAQVTLRVDPGPVYGIVAFDVEYVEPPPPEDANVPRDLAALELEHGQPALAADVLSAVSRVGEALRNQGYPFGKAVGHTARVDHAERTMSVTVKAESGPPAVFGSTAFEGLDTVEERYLRRLVEFHQGAPYDQRAVQGLRRTLLETGLFQAISIDPAEAVDADGALPLTVRVEEADHRSIGVGARYSSSLGIGADVFWEHRNLFGEDEDFRAELDVSERANTLGAAFSKPLFLNRRGQFLRANVEVATEEFEAYDRTGVLAEISIERRLSPTWTGSVGTNVEHAEITDGDGARLSTLWGLPVRVWRDDTDSRLDPRDGSRLDFEVVPYTGMYDGGILFARNRAEGRLYYPLTDDGWTVLAGRVAVGAIVGAGRRDVPPDKRFYSGGGGSVRGYGYQLATDIDENNDPIGGKSLFEIGLELRRQVTETIGIVPFIEGGRAFSDQIPNPAGDLFWGAGIGVRYYSPVGPIRFDVAVPLDRRENVDDPYQLYISLGQAF